ncbi:LysR substrate-binding domain-containing protein [Pseudoduganella aquatica]|uniref:LysR family transcriptional regulator n=1 Tax=Pseudoduganella aquatica TaxID=2660641 RepID=A0A7X4HBQ0_9BURK|nr:LysR substrate-binding domain-containing protein [Pseudoduganella aquatica]MYN07969.1 LysR family transcriptional regulator [Pseudoduganella aquatica]
MRIAELRVYHHFLILAQELHFGRAADIAHITQPALSQQIARLEDGLGVKLFAREQRQLSLTPAGAVFRDGIAQLMSDLDRLTERTLAAAGGEDYSMAIGIVEYANLPLVSATMSLLQQAYPAARLTRHNIHCVHHGSALMRGVIDVGIGIVLAERQPPMPLAAGIDSQRVASSQWRLLMPQTHRLAGAGRLPLHCLGHENVILPAREVNPSVYDGIMHACNAAGIVPNVVYETSQALFGIQLARDGLGLMLGSAFSLDVAPPGMVTVPLDGLPALEIIANWRADECRAIVKQFLELLGLEGCRHAELGSMSPARTRKAATKPAPRPS